MNQLIEEAQRRIEELAREAEKIHELIGLLTTELVQGWRCYHVANSIRQAYADKRINCMYYFLVTVRVSCENSVILILTNLVSEQKRHKTANIGYLLSQFETWANKTMKFVNFTGNEHFEDVSRTSALTLRVLDKNLPKYISQDRQRVESIRPTIEKLELYRNTVIAHIDRRLINDPASLVVEPLPYQNEMESAFEILFGIIKRYSWYLGYDVRFEEHGQGALEDFGYLIGMIQRDNESDAAVCQ
jgi:hypothetical protein